MEKLHYFICPLAPLLRIGVKMFLEVGIDL